jgi:hypothetical protein
MNEAARKAQSMSEASRKAQLEASRFLITDNVVENSNAAAGYLHLVGQYYGLQNPAGMKTSLKCAIACIKAAARAFNELEALDAPQDQRGAAE